MSLCLQLQPSATKPVKVKQERVLLGYIRLFLKDTPVNNHINGQLSTRTRPYFIMVVDRFIFKNNQTTLSSVSPPCLKLVRDYPKKG